MKQNLIIEILPLISRDMADGPSYVVTRLCESLISQHSDINLISCYNEELDLIPAYLKCFPLGILPHKLCHSPKMYQWLQSLAQSNMIKLIHSHGLWTMPTIYPSRISKYYYVPNISSPHGSLAKYAIESGSWVKKIFWPLLQHPALKATTCFHATAESEYYDIRRLGFKQPVAIIPNGIDIPDDIPKQKQQFRTLLFLGRINPIKGLDMLLMAWKVLQNQFPEWQLQIAGPDSHGYLKTIKNMANNLMLERVIFSGLLSGKAKWAAYRNAEIFILPSYSENFAVTAAEAMASGTPIVATTGTPWQMVKKHQAGWFVETNVDSITACLVTALKCSPAELAVMGQNGRSWMERDFSWLHISEMMQKTYSWILEGGITPEWVKLD